MAPIRPQLLVSHANHSATETSKKRMFNEPMIYVVTRNHAYVCMYVCVYVCMYVCMYACVCMYFIFEYIMYVCMYVVGCIEQV